MNLTLKRGFTLFGTKEFIIHNSFFLYKTGYAGYYGLSIIVGSYPVLFVSLAAHAAQFAFLVFFENPRKFAWFFFGLASSFVCVIKRCKFRD